MIFLLVVNVKCLARVTRFNACATDIESEGASPPRQTSTPRVPPVGLMLAPRWVAPYGMGSGVKPGGNTHHEEGAHAHVSDLELCWGCPKNVETSADLNGVRETGNSRHYAFQS